MWKTIHGVLTVMSTVYFVLIICTLPLTGVFSFLVALVAFFLLLFCIFHAGERSKIDDAQRELNSQLWQVEKSIEQLRDFVTLARTLVNHDTESLIVDYIERNKLMVEKEDE